MLNEHQNQINPFMGNKKRKREGLASGPPEEIDTSKPTAIYHPTDGRKYTLSLALPSSILANAQTPDLQSQLVGTIARALAVFCVDEVVVFEDGQRPASRQSFNAAQYNGYSDPGYFMMHVLSYLECPPNLRKSLFPMHPDLRLAGALPSLDMPHHLRPNEWCRYREGVTVPEGKENKDFSHFRRVDTGLATDIYVDRGIPLKTRVTLILPEDANTNSSTIIADAVDPNAPRIEAGYYWGYQVRSASAISAIFTESPYKEGYDLTIGTSERGVSIGQLNSSTQNLATIPRFNHMLIVVGGVAGLEVAVKADEKLQKMKVQTPEALFDFWVNLVPGQGSRTIRTEEAVWLALMGLNGIVKEKGIK